MQLLTSKGEKFQIDEEDFDRVSKHKWARDKRQGYFRTHVNVNGKETCVLLHRLIMNPPRNRIVDHIDRDPSNNKKSNLRICKDADNQRNRIKHMKASSRHIGVYWKSSMKKWAAHAREGDKYHIIGYFDSEDEAALAYNKFARERFGEYPNMNQVAVAG